MKKVLCYVMFATMLCSCGGCGSRADVEPGGGSIYHWKTVFAPNKAELDFMKRHDIGRLYIKMFDVVVEQNYVSGCTEVVPVATTRFQGTVPKGVEVVPVAYITLEALRAMQGKEVEFAELIAERMLAMCSYNECGEIYEIQLDCDWTASTRTTYDILCQAVKDVLFERGIDLSITVRLHQLTETPPAADRGVLMLYNTGRLKSIDTKNSILDIKDAKPYIKSVDYPIPLDYAYPTFGWGVRFVDGEFVSIVSEDEKASEEGEHIRYERPTSEDILAVKALVEEHLGKPSMGNILYHLDMDQLKHYTHGEVDKILAR